MPDTEALFQSEYRQQYRAQPFWKRSVILLAGIAVNLLFAMVAFIVIFSVIGMTEIMAMNCSAATTPASK